MECNSLLFGDRNTWFKHELQNHRSHYNCNFCDRTGFQSKASIVEHLSYSHNSSSQDQLSILADASYMAPSHLMAQDCPFCDDWAAILEQRTNPKGKRVGVAQNVSVSTMKFKRHVATHQEQLAVFVLPWSSDPDIDQNNESDGTFAANPAGFEENHDELSLEEDDMNEQGGISAIMRGLREIERGADELFGRLKATQDFQREVERGGKEETKSHILERISAIETKMEAIKDFPREIDEIGAGKPHIKFETMADLNVKITNITVELEEKILAQHTI
ncbi:hypothetical protein F4818DRAFT_419127 [Hypoxylon cercidicola]|nr:hypothetical protein F4818DRAFT_419127 [Hypoxylon cercidicola]